MHTKIDSAGMVQALWKLTNQWELEGEYGNRLWLFLSPFIIRIRSLHIFIKKSASRYSFVQLRSMFTGAPPDDYTVIKIPLIYQEGSAEDALPKRLR